jgi:hypothetical protein
MPKIYSPTTTFRAMARVRDLGTDPVAGMDENQKLIVWDPASGQTRPFPG